MILTGDFIRHYRLHIKVQIKPWQILNNSTPTSRPSNKTAAFWLNSYSFTSPTIRPPVISSPAFSFQGNTPKQGVKMFSKCSFIMALNKFWEHECILCVGKKESIIIVQLLCGSKFSIGHVWTQEVSKYKSMVATSWRWFGYFWLFFPSSSSWSAVCQSPHSLSREEFSPVIHPSCGRLHGQLKKNCLARPKRGDHMLQCDLPSAQPLSPLGPHLWGFRGHSACGFFRNGPGRKT